MDPTFDGLPVFGTACKVVHRPNPDATQQDAYFGVTGLVQLYGGGRGRVFEVQGLFVDTDLPSLLAQEALLLTYGDGIARTFVDTQGRAWPNVVFRSEYQPSPDGPRPTDFGWCLPFRCTLHGLQ
jgi:hypothetical protein